MNLGIILLIKVVIFVKNAQKMLNVLAGIVLWSNKDIGGHQMKVQLYLFAQISLKVALQKLLKQQ